MLEGQDSFYQTREAGGSLAMAYVRLDGTDVNPIAPENRSHGRGFDGISHGRPGAVALKAPTTRLAITDLTANNAQERSRKILEYAPLRMLCRLGLVLRPNKSSS